MDLRDIVLTGIPRSGTTLVCHLLNKLPDTIALHEPLAWMDFEGLASHEAVCDGIDRFFQETRKSCLEDGSAISQHVDGAVPDNPIGAYPSFPPFVRRWAGRLPWQGVLSRIGLRRVKALRGRIRTGKTVSPEFFLCVKHTGPFTALLRSLRHRHPCYAVVRNPLAVLLSWNSIRFALQQGHMLEAERLNPTLARELSQIEDRIARQIHLLSWFFESYRSLLPADNVLRYEDVVASRGTALRVITERAGKLAESLENKNTNSLYDAQLIPVLAERLASSEGAMWDFYDKASLAQARNARVTATTLSTSASDNDE